MEETGQQDPHPELTSAPVNEAPSEKPDGSYFGQGGNTQDVPAMQTGVVPPTRVQSQAEDTAAPPTEGPATESAVEGTQEPVPEAVTNPEEVSSTEYTSAAELMSEYAEDPMVKPMVMWLDSQLSDSEVDINRAFANVLKSGDIGYLDEGYLKEKLGDKADTVIDYAKSLWSFTQAKAEEQMQSIYSKFGGEEAAKQAGQYFNANADEASKGAIKRMLDSGDKELVSYAVSQIVQFSKTSGATVQHNAPAMGEQAVSKGLSLMEFREQSAKVTNEQDYSKLMELRRLGIQQGL